MALIYVYEAQLGSPPSVIYLPLVILESITQPQFIGLQST